MKNRLAEEMSPYLLQHARNPVDWRPWGEEALRKAREDDKPIFLSIGYSSCHWCHVMARESFEDKATAAFMNEHFVNVKVDREERPDLDAVYMGAVQAITGRGGWPMSVWLTPGGEPFYGGTYFPKNQMGGMPSFRQALEAASNAWLNNRDGVVGAGKELLAHLKTPLALGGESSEPESAFNPDMSEMVASLSRDFDRVNGGWSGPPKFPQPMIIEFLLRHSVRMGSEDALRTALFTLSQMARGGVYDQLGGGFHRYSVDEKWLVPHFEKMLYDNSQLARVYLHAWQMTGERMFKTVAAETLNCVAREMLRPGGGFYSSQDADSEGEEGKFFVWKANELHTILGDEAELFSAAYGVSEKGNFEGCNILHVVRDIEDLVDRFGLPPDRIENKLAEARKKLLSVREARVKPGRDEKILASWNGMMLAAFSEAARVFDDLDYREIAIETAGFLLAELRTPEGRLLRSWTKSGGGRLNGYLEDYTHLIEGLLELYQTTFDPRWFVAARELADLVSEHFSSPGSLFYDTSDDHEQLIARPREIQDNAIPSGNAMAACVLMKLGAFIGDSSYLQKAENLMRGMLPLVKRYPTAFGQWLCAFEFATSDLSEIAVVGDPGAADVKAMLREIFSAYRPSQIVALKRPGEISPIPLLEGREALTDGDNAKAAAYVCRNFSCLKPTTDLAELRGLIEGRN